MKKNKKTLCLPNKNSNFAVKHYFIELSQVQKLNYKHNDNTTVDNIQHADTTEGTV